MDKVNSGTGGGAPRAEVVKVGTISLSWDPGPRLAVMSFSEPTIGTGPAAASLVEAMKRWVGTDSRPFGFLVDAKNNPSVDIQWRSTWSTFYRVHKDSAVIAVFSMGAMARVAAELFRLAIGLKLKGFSQEGEARDWLRTQGIRA